MTRKAHIGSFTPDPQNARKHNPRNIGMIEKSLQDAGFGRSILVTADDTIIAGNATMEALAQIGMEEAIVVDSDGKRPIIVRRTDLTYNDPRARELALADNRAAELAEWDPAILDQIKIEFPEAIDATFRPEELDALLGVQAAAQATKEPSQIPLPPTPTSALNTVWRLGEHVLVCGDAQYSRAWDLLDQNTGGNVIQARLLATDPPFNVDRVVGGKDYTEPSYRSGGRELRDLENDNLPIDQYRDMLDRSFFHADVRLIPGGGVYMFGPSTGPNGIVFRDAYASLWPIRQTIIWVKQHFVFGTSDFHWRHEVIWYGWKPGGNRLPVSDRGQTTVWEVSRPTQTKDMVHPSQKPVELAALIVANGSAPGETVLDPFCGTGSTLLACEQLGRRCAAIELDPVYCDLIVANWQELTGEQAEIVHEEIEAE